MRFLMFVLLVLGFVLMAGLGAAPASAATGTCLVNPSFAATGTTLSATCTGLAPNQVANTYFVEPDGRTQEGCEGENVHTSPCSPRANASGTVSFSIVTAEPADEGFAQLGTWHIVADNPNGASAVGWFTLTGSGAGVSGATLTITSIGHNAWAVYGTGFGAGEIVNGWFDLPLDCSGSEHPGVSTSNMSQDDFRVPSPKASAAGTVAFTFGTAQFDTEASYCTGTWKLTLRGLASGNGASAWFEVTGNSVTPDGVSSIRVVLRGVIGDLFANASTLTPSVTIVGSNFPPHTGVNCWSTRPDGRVFAFEEAAGTLTDAGGSFAVSGLVEPVGDSFTQSTEPGTWHETCATPDHSSLAVTTFVLNSLTIDP